MIFKPEIKDRECQCHFQTENFLTHKDVKVLSPRIKRRKTANQGSNTTGTFASYFQPVLPEESRLSSLSEV